MKTFKKVLCFFLALLTIGCLCACEEKQDEPEEKETVSAEDKDTDFEDVEDVKTEDSEDTGNEDAELNADYSFFDKEKYTATQETSSQGISITYDLIEATDRKVSLGMTLAGKTITFNTTKISDLINSGWTLVSGNKADTTVKSMQATNAVVCAPNGKQATIYAANLTDSETAFSNCVVWDIKISYPNASSRYNDKALAADFAYSGKISSASSMKTIIQELGDPNYIYITEYVLDGAYQYSRITLAYSDNVEAQFSFRLEGGTAKMIEATFKYDQFKNK